METGMMKLMRGLMWSMGIFFAIVMALGIGRAFYCSFLEDGRDFSQLSRLQQAREYETLAEQVDSPSDELNYRILAAEAYADTRDKLHPDTLEIAEAMVPRMQELLKENQLPRQEAGYRLFSMLTHANGNFNCLAAHIQSGVYDFSAESGHNNRRAASKMLREMLAIVDKLRYGNEVQQLKPIILSMLQQGARTVWPDIKPDDVLMCSDPNSIDPVLTAVRTRDAAFLRAVLDCKLPPRGILDDCKPEIEAEWQNSPDLVEILRSHYVPQAH